MLKNNNIDFQTITSNYGRHHKKRIHCICNLSEKLKMIFICLIIFILIDHTGCSIIKRHKNDNPQTYNNFKVEEVDGTIVNLIPIAESNKPLWALDVNQKKWDWNRNNINPMMPFFEGPIPFVLPPQEGSGEPFYSHNHQPSITYLDNGDLMAIWFSTNQESGTEMTVLVSRFRAGEQTWDSSSEFFKAENRNMTGSSLFNNGNGKLFHFNSIGPENSTGWANLAMLLRTSVDNGVRWTSPSPIAPQIKGRHQIISGTIKTAEGIMIQPCDAHHSSSGGTALHISKDGGKTWIDSGEGKSKPLFIDGGSGEGTIAGIHGGIVELKDGSLLALGRSDNINGHMPMSISRDLGKTWTYSASPFPPISSGQRLVLMRLQEGPILLVSFTHHPRVEGLGITFTDENGNKFQGKGMYAALSYDEGKNWSIKKLITPGHGEFDGGAWTGKFKATSSQAEPMGYLSAIQTPDKIIHLISSRLHYRFNLKWIETPSPTQ